MYAAAHRVPDGDDPFRAGSPCVCVWGGPDESPRGTIGGASRSKLVFGIERAPSGLGEVVGEPSAEDFRFSSSEVDTSLLMAPQPACPDERVFGVAEAVVDAGREASSDVPGRRIRASLAAIARERLAEHHRITTRILSS